MKLAIYALLVANVVMLGWLYRDDGDMRDVPVAVTSLPAGVEPLRLLSERVTPVRHSSDTSTDVSDSQMSAQAVEAVSQPITQSESPAKTEETQGMAPPAAVEDVVIQNTQTAPLPPICQTVGPFADRKTANAIAAKLTGLGAVIKLRDVTTEYPSGYWVYLSAMPLADAQRIVADFEANGVQDYFLGRQNFISLGVYSDKRIAEARMQEISDMGYSPRLEPRFLSRAAYWIDVEERENARISAEQWDALLADPAGIKRQSITCK